MRDLRLSLFDPFLHLIQHLHVPLPENSRANVVVEWIGQVNRIEKLTEQSLHQREILAGLHG